MVYLSQATRFWPRDAEYRHERAGQLMNLGDMEWALRDQRIAIEEEPDNGWHQYRMGRIVQATQGLDQARPYYQRAMQHSDSRKAAMEQYCQGLVMGSVMQMGGGGRPMHAHAGRRVSDGRRGLAATHAALRGNPEGIAAIDKFIEYADPNEPSHQATLPMARQWKAQLQGNGQGAK